MLYIAVPNWGSLIITTNLEFSKWTEVFGEEQMTAALLDRLIHNAHLLNINGGNFRSICYFLTYFVKYANIGDIAMEANIGGFGKRNK